MKTFTLIAVICTIMFLPLTAMFAQSELAVTPIKIKKSFWFDLGLGWGGQGTAFDLGFSYEVTKNRLMSLHFSSAATNDHCEDIVLFIPVGSPLGKTAETLDLSYGVMRKGKVSVITVAAGVSYVTIKTGGGTAPAGSSVPIIYYTNCPADYTLEKEGTVGLALRGQYIPSWLWGGLGISPYLNVNPKYTFGSVTVNLAFGRMRPRNVKV